MHPDLIGLEITKGELRRLTGFKPDQVLRSSIIANREQRSGFFSDEMLVILVLTLIIVGVSYAFIILPTIGSSITLVIILLIIVPIVLIAGRSLWRRLTFPKTLKTLLDKVDKYHEIIKTIDINDQPATSGNETSIDDREKVVTALQLVREDLVQSLKTERIMRDNKKLLAHNQDLFVNHVEMLHATSLQVSSHDSQYAQLLNQSLQIALDVQAEVRKLQSSR
ncbi:MAG: hypothetical protein DSM106950_19035 [Stigonema ocellatum SAG 48.90 = DSM 106950]|nr:hypothetical protein [Stigonema ocellatum SAG 48.90 = DSM 106950]